MVLIAQRCAPLILINDSSWSRVQAVGVGSANAAAALMASMIGGSQSAPTQEKINNIIAGLSPMQLFDIMSQMKTLIQQNQQAARDILSQNPQLTRALFQAQVMLGMVKPSTGVPSQGQGEIWMIRHVYVAWRRVHGAC